jgi:4-carboxymuconolactone decarboxylase
LRLVLALAKGRALLLREEFREHAMTNHIPAPSRLPPLSADSYDQAQKDAQADFVATRKVGFSGPWHVFIRSPELLTHAQRMGEYLRYRCKLSGRISEFVILLVARDWTQDYEFGTHRNHGLKAGLTEAIIEAVRDGRRPEGLDEELSIIWDFVTELLRARRVSDTSYGRALARFGEQGIIDLAGIIGYYSLLAMTMNVARVSPPDGESYLPRFPE